MSVKPTLAFAGIGLMGLPMCRRLLAAGYSLRVWNRTPDKCRELEQAGACRVESPVQLGDGADVVMLCLADTAAVREVVFGAAGLAAGPVAGKLLLDFSSLDPAATREMAAELERCGGMRWIDAPVSGGVPGAEAGTLAIMAGGRREDIDALRPILAHLGPVSYTHLTLPTICSV